MNALPLTLLSVLEKGHRVRLRKHLQGVLIDGAPEAAKAIGSLLPAIPAIPVIRCLRHVCENARKAGGREGRRDTPTRIDAMHERREAAIAAQQEVR